MNIARLKLFGVLAVSALALGYLLQDVVEALIVRPLLFLLWSLGVFYRFIPQPLVWLVLVLAMLYMAVGHIPTDYSLPRLRAIRPRPVRGPLAELAGQIERKDEGVYFKWQIARRLAEIALDLQGLRRQSRRLDFETGGPSPQVRAYLEAGLNSSFSDYPLPGGLPMPGMTAALPPTPFDNDITPVLEYLETQMENNDDHRRA